MTLRELIQSLAVSGVNANTRFVVETVTRHNADETKDSSHTEVFRGDGATRKRIARLTVRADGTVRATLDGSAVVNEIPSVLIHLASS
jgi:hypothetical protein